MPISRTCLNVRARHAILRFSKIFLTMFMPVIQFRLVWRTSSRKCDWLRAKKLTFSLEKSNLVWELDVERASHTALFLKALFLSVVRPDAAQYLRH